MVFDGESFHLISFSRATWRIHCSLVEGLPGDNSSTKETCSRRSFASSLVGVERREVGSGIVDAVLDGELLESTCGHFLAGVIYAGGCAKETGSMISGFKRASNDAFLELEIGCIWDVEGRG